MIEAEDAMVKQQNKVENDRKTKQENQLYLLKDPEAFAHNLAHMMEESGKAWAAYLEPRENAFVLPQNNTDEMTDILKTINQVSEYWLSDPKRTLEAQTRLMSGFMNLWTGSIRRMTGEQVKPAAEPASGDKRFTHEEWKDNHFFDFCKQIYLITSNWADDLINEATELDEGTKQKANFYMKQIFNALSPSNFVMTNPEVLRDTLESNGENLVKGMKMLAEDIKAGKGDLRIRQTSKEQFKIGENIATTKGKVVFQNEICQLLQYNPTTEEVLKRPLLIIPPWINKYYILDLNEEKSFIKWAVSQGHSVFTVSWVNPDLNHAHLTFEDYMQKGIIEVLDAIENMTGEKGVNAIGYCVGGTLLSATLAWAAKTGEKRIKSATFFTTQVDFEHAGDLKVFIDEEQVSGLEKSMNEAGYLEGMRMSMAFNMLRSNDLIWPYVINNYLRGKEPFPFDLLFWNSDSTSMPAANHSFYLRQCYLENNLSQGRMLLGGQTLSLKDVKTPIYTLATKEDHIAPPQSVHYGASFFGGDVTYVLGGSGHIAGVINPPSRNKYNHWTKSYKQGESYQEWLSKAKSTEGSWWPHWHQWIEKQDNIKVKARSPEDKPSLIIENAPGSYVRMSA